MKLYIETGRWLPAIFIGPFERMTDAPLWGWLCAFGLAAWQVVRSDAFSGLLPIVLLASCVDYYYGRKASRTPYDPVRAHTGIVSKSSGLVLVGLLRLIEFWLYAYDLANTKGMCAVAVGVWLFSADVRSIMKHRESFGAKPIPFLSALLDWLQNLFTNRLPISAHASQDPSENDSRFCGKFPP